MTRWTRLAARFYPRAWRERYEHEFAALLEDTNGGWRETADVLRGALMMQLLKGTGFAKLALALAAIGAIVGFAASFATRRHVSTATVRMEPKPLSATPDPAWETDLALEAQFSFSTERQLAEINDRLKLYPGSSRDAVKRMRQDLRFSRTSPQPGVTVVKIDFEYPDRDRARQVVDEVSSLVSESINRAAQRRSNGYHEIWHETPPEIQAAVAASPRMSIAQSWYSFAFWGLAAGVLLALALDRPRQVGAAAAGGAIGCLLAIGVSFFMTPRYRSEAFVKFTPAYAPVALTQVAYQGTAMERFRNNIEKVRGPETLRDIAQQLNLYPGSNADDAAERLKHDLTLSASQDPISATISFTHPDPRISAMVTNQIAGQLIEQHLKTGERNAMRFGERVRYMEMHQLGDKLTLLGPAQRPTQSSSPNRIAFGGVGAIAGMIFGLVALHRRRPVAEEPVLALNL